MEKRNSTAFLRSEGCNTGSLAAQISRKDHGIKGSRGDVAAVPGWLHGQLGEGGLLIKGMNCPVSRVARKFSRLCISEEVLLVEWLQAKVSRQQHVLNEKQYCSYLVKW